MLTLPVVLAAGAAALAPLAAAQSRIVEVTVYPDRAEIVREARIEVPAGSSLVEYPGLPWGLEPDSLRVTARGVPASLGGVELHAEAREPAETPELIAAREEVRRLESALSALDAEDQTDAELKEFIAALRATTAARESKNLGGGGVDAASIQAVYGFVRSGMQDLGAARLARADKRAGLTRQLEVARGRLASSKPAGAIRSRVARVEVSAERAGSLTIRLAYLAPGVSWRPAYRASLDPAAGEILLAGEGVVRQTTGEDWSDVTMRLSTAAPARGVKPPRLEAWLLRPMEIGLLQSRDSVMRLRAQAGGFADILTMAQGVTDGDGNPLLAPAESPASRPEATLVHTSYNVSFEVPGRASIPSDDAEHRVFLREERLAARVEYRSVPSSNEAAFLVAKTTSPAGYPLLAGSARVFAGGAYLGSFGMPETGPGAELTIPFGIDNRITVGRTKLPQERGEEGIIGKDRRIAYGFTTTVENRLDRAATVIVEERVPVSEDERIEVIPGRETTPGATTDKERPGVMEWAVTLEPKQKKEIVLAYALRFPRELIVPGID